MQTKILKYHFNGIFECRQLVNLINYSCTVEQVFIKVKNNMLICMIDPEGRRKHARIIRQQSGFLESIKRILPGFLNMRRLCN